MENNLYDKNESTVISVRFSAEEMRILAAIMRKVNATQSKVLQQSLRTEAKRLKIK